MAVYQDPWSSNPFSNAHIDYQREKAKHDYMRQMNAMQNQMLDNQCGFDQLNGFAAIKNQKPISQPEPNKVLLLLGDI